MTTMKMQINTKIQTVNKTSARSSKAQRTIDVARRLLLANPGITWNYLLYFLVFGWGIWL